MHSEAFFVTLRVIEKSPFYRVYTPIYEALHLVIGKIASSGPLGSSKLVNVSSSITIEGCFHTHEMRAESRSLYTRVLLPFYSG